MKKKLDEYLNKRDVKKSHEPTGDKQKTSKKNLYVIQKHHASHLHYDLRLEVDGVLKSWAVPKGAPETTKDKRLAILVEDHPIDYASFEGVIPKGQYGAGKVEIWDSGHYRNTKVNEIGKEVSMKQCLKNGQIEIAIEGKKLKGKYALVHFEGKNWFFIKMKENHD